MKKLSLPACALSLLLAAYDANAASCSVTSVTGLSFGSYDVFSGSALDTVGSFTYTCNNVDPADTVVVHLSAGAGGYLPRSMFQGTYQLDYNLYLNAGRTQVWGDGTAGTSYFGPVIPAEGSPATVDVYGRIPAGQNAKAGSYQDTVIVTVLF